MKARRLVLRKMKKRILVSSFGFLLVITTLVTAVTIQRVAVTNASSARKGHHSPTPCPSPNQRICQGQVLVLSHGPGKTSPAPTPTVPVASAPVPPSNTGTGSGGGGTNTEKQLALQLFNQINSDRNTQGGLPAYTLNSTLSNGAYQHTVLMTTTNCASDLHQCPNEPPIGDRLTNEGINWMAACENVGNSSPRPDAWGALKTVIEGGMLAEQPPDDGHRQCLLSTSYHQIGIGVLIDSQGVVWVTEDFTN
jgi:uncharacterized protein YkwD